MKGDYRLFGAFVGLLLSAVAASQWACAPGTDEQVAGVGEPIITSRAYKGHENDRDMNFFVTEYRDALGTRLDDCQTCHRGGDLSYEVNGSIRKVTKNPCDYCHLVDHPDAEALEAMPVDYRATLNPYGLAYVEAGRTGEALRAVAGQDSDGDGYANSEEVASLRYPGDPGSEPGQPVAPMRIIRLEDIKEMAAHEQFLIANSHTQKNDFYAGYRGVGVVDLLKAVGVDPGGEGFEGITVIAPDGYRKDFSADAITREYPEQLFYSGLDAQTLGDECGFVDYPDVLPRGLVDGGVIPGEQWLMLAYERNGAAIPGATLDITSGKLEGEGPLRLVVPQSQPGPPDRGSSVSPTGCGDGYDYDEAKDHNAGEMVRGVIGIQVNPSPAGYEGFDYQNGGWAFIDSQSLVLYGFGIENP